jgi:glutamate-1-semialdehyde aminotransferase
MELVAPSGPVYQAGTLSGNPLSISAGLATLKVIHSTDGFYDTLEKNAAYLSKGLLDSFDKAGVKVRLNRVGSMMTLFFNGGEDVHDAQSARRADRNLYARFFHGMMNKGIYLAPSQFEASPCHLHIPGRNSILQSIPATRCWFLLKENRMDSHDKFILDYLQKRTYPTGRKLKCSEPQLQTRGE